MQTIVDYIKNSEKLQDELETVRGRNLAGFVEGSDVWYYDAIQYDEDTDEVCKVIFLDENREETWAVSDILSYATVDDVPEDRKEIWKKYMSRYEWNDPTYNNISNLLARFRSTK